MATTVLAAHMGVPTFPYGSFAGKEQTEAVAEAVSLGTLVPHRWIKAVCIALAFVLTSCLRP